MQFNSYLFVLAFLPIALSGYFLLNHFKQYTIGKIFLLIMSVWFCGSMNYKYIVILFVSIIGNYLGLLLISNSKNKLQKRTWFLLTVLGNILLLGYFKYFNFFISSVNSFFGTGISSRSLLIPLGISFYTFQQLSFVVDVYEGKAVVGSFIDYSVFASFFPCFVSGPIILHGSILPQLNDLKRKEFNYENLNRGLYLFVLGMGKKVLIANTLGLVVDAAYNDVSQLGCYVMVLVVIAYTFQIYFDFSGYSDMARGIALMINFDVPINFDSPYKATDPKDFWRRWHISLTTWLTNYIYFPLGGNRRGNIRTYLNIVIVFLVSGIWHGANYTFIVWGLLWGVAQCVTRAFQSFFNRLPVYFDRIGMFLFTTLTWIVFRSKSLSEVGQVFSRFLDFRNPFEGSSVLSNIWLPEIRFLARNRSFLDDYVIIFVTLILILLVCIVLFTRNSNERVLCFRANWKNAILVSGLLVWCILSFSSVSTFIYSNF